MDFVKREDPNVLDEESYKVYIDSVSILQSFVGKFCNIFFKCKC